MNGNESKSIGYVGFCHESVGLELLYDLDGIIDEIDEDGSGTMDFDEFCTMMMSK